MISPTFASFKPVKQHNHCPNALAQMSVNTQPRTFHQLKNSANIIKNGPQYGFSGLRQGPPQQKITFNLVNQTRRNPINQNMKKTLSQVNFLESQNQPKVIQKLKSKPKLNVKNYVTAKKNYVQVERVSKDKCINRPSIIGPSLLKNKSFIYIHRNQNKQNLARPSHEGFKGSFRFSEQNSIDSIERRSQDISISVGSSNGDSFFNSSKFQDSLNLKDSRSSSGKVDNTLNFGRKSNQTIYKGDNSRAKNQEDSTYFGEPNSSLSMMAKDMHSSFQQQTSLNQPAIKKSFQNASINFSKKFKHYRKPKQHIQQKPTTIQQFDLREQIGQGKYGKVYMARHKLTGFICALKTISKSKIQQQNIQQPLIRQIKIQMYLNHPNIVKLYGFFHDKQNLYLIMECCMEGHLLKMIKQRKLFEQSEILEIITSVFEAVSFLHCHGIIHRDLKPQNIVIQNGIYKICDFGWAAYAKGDTRTTFCGTPLYVCPEVLKGDQYDAKADVWGLGVLTYELAYGRVPFPIWSQSDMLKIVKDPVYFPTWTNISQKMQNLIKEMLNKDPNKRSSLNQILASPLITQYVGTRLGIKSQIQALF